MDHTNVRRKKVGKRARKNERGSLTYPQQSVAINRMKPWIVPPRTISTLKFIGVFSGMGAGLITTSRSYYPNGLFDFDAALASSAIAGFVEMHSLYRVNRVLRFRYRVTVVNRDTLGLVICTALTPQTVSAGSFTINMYGNGRSKVGMVGIATGGNDKLIHEDSVDLLELFGNTAVDGDLSNFFGTVGTNPSTLMGFQIGVYNPQGTNMTAGIQGLVEAWFEVEWSDPTTLSY